MNGQTFLQKALEQSFQKPLMTDYNNIDFVFCRDSSGSFIMGDKSSCHFAPCLISSVDIKNFINNSWYDIRRSRELNEEYETFRHYFEENSFIPEDSPTIQSLRLWLDLTSVSRQAAQKKRVIATLMPPSFKETIAEMEKGYRKALKKIKKCEEDNLDAVEIAQITDFTETYQKIIHTFHWLDIFYFFNKKKLWQSLNDALEIIAEDGDISPRFELTHPFLGSAHKFTRSYADQYRRDMFVLINKIKAMADNSSLLELTSLFLKTPRQYKTAFHDFKNRRKAPKLDDIIAIKKAAQTMFNEFTRLCYLEGVRKAFEVKFLDTCPATQNPKLPSVSPDEEIGKIRNIVESCRQIDYKKTKTGKFYFDALQNYRKACAKIDKIFIDYVGIPNAKLEKDIT